MYNFRIVYKDSDGRKQIITNENSRNLNDTWGFVSGSVRVLINENREILKIEILEV